NGCSYDAIAAAVGLTPSDLFLEPKKPALQVVRSEKPPLGRPTHVASFAYVDEQGDLLYEACRLEYPLQADQAKPKKTYRQRRPDPDNPGEWIWDADGVRLVPYRLPELIEAVAHGRPIYIPEGEKHCDTLYELRLPATCNVGGAGKWRDEYSKIVAGS